MSLTLKKILWSNWDKARGPLTEDLKTIETVLNSFIARFGLGTGSGSGGFGIGGDPTPQPRYVSNLGPGHTPFWSLIDLVNGVMGFLSLSHLGPASQGSILVGREPGLGGPYEEILLGTGLQMVGTTLSATAGVPYFIPSGSVFTVPLNYQALWETTIDNEGTIVVDGLLIQVD